ncbi:perforin-1 [Rhineura floridana]|uniref:perforin-1 n=1 Tax=Rhineura floridana TaxID=261503 RepID=UPI002AC8628D|nr:perforin-1 [Rhineura floridana]
MNTGQLLPPVPAAAKGYFSVGSAMFKGSPATSLPLLLLFTSVSPQCQTGSESECQEHTDFVPGHSLAGEGIDITTLEKKGAKVLDMNQWQKLDGSCILCRNPLLEGKPLQKLPLTVTDWEAKVACHRKVHTSLQESGLSVVQEEGSDVKNNWKAGLDVDVKPKINTHVALVGSHSKMADFSVQKSSQDKYSFASHEVSCSYYSFRTGHHWVLTHHFKHAVKNLPKKYQPASRLEYRQLIETYGTHFIRQIHLGGRVRDVTAVRVCEVALDGVTADEVKDCLSIEASVSIGDKGKMDAAYEACEELKKKKNFKGSFHQTYSERQTEIVGGNSQTDLLFSDDQNAEAFKDWLEGLKSMPGLVSYSLEPIHTLVPKEDPKRESLRQALSEYVTERALWRNCTQPCPQGTQRSARDACSCVCSSDSTTNSMCCSRERGLGKLTVTIQRAHDLWGDYFTRTDAYIKVFYMGREMRTSTIWNNNNPEWKVHLDVGNVQVLGETSKVRVQVWDEDNKWDDDLLGSCDRTLQSGKPHNEICYFAHGQLQFQYHLVCGPYLGGPYCLDYIPHQPKYVGDLLQRKTDTMKQKAP